MPARSSRACSSFRCVTCSGACTCTSPGRPNRRAWGCASRRAASRSVPTRSCSNASSAIWCRTRSSTPSAAASSWWRGRPNRTSTWRSGTPASASAPPTCARFSTSSFRSAAASACARRGWAWGWRSSSVWCACSGTSWSSPRSRAAERCSACASRSAGCPTFKTSPPAPTPCRCRCCNRAPCSCSTTRRRSAKACAGCCRSGATTPSPPARSRRPSGRWHFSTARPT